MDWSKIVENMLTITVPILVLLLANRLSTKKDIDKRHAQNLDMFNELIAERKYFPVHDHMECDDEPLTARGIRRAPKNYNGGNR